MQEGNKAKHGCKGLSSKAVHSKEAYSCVLWQLAQLKSNGAASSPRASTVVTDRPPRMHVEMMQGSSANATLPLY